MKSEAVQLLNLRRLPGRLTAEEAAWLLGFVSTDIPILVSHRLLKPLGQPAANAPRYFCGAELEELRGNKGWLDKSSAALARHWRTRNERLRPQTLPAATVAGQ